MSQMTNNFNTLLPAFSSDTLARMYEELYHASQFYSARMVLERLDEMVGRTEAVNLISEYRHLIGSEHKLIG